MVRHSRVVFSWVLVAGLLGLVACGSASSTPRAAPASTSPMPGDAFNVTSASADTLLEPTAFADAMIQPGTVTINVHTPFEGKINAGDVMIPYDQIQQQVAALPADRATPLAVYCRSGNMSAIAVQTLAGLGFVDIVELRGGMDAWRASGRTLLMTP